MGVAAFPVLADSRFPGARPATCVSDQHLALRVAQKILHAGWLCASVSIGHDDNRSANRNEVLQRLLAGRQGQLS